MKKAILTILIVFSLFFMKINAFAGTTTCKYSLSNVSRKVVSFNDYGVGILNNSGQSEITDTNDHNLVMTLTDPANGSVDTLNGVVSFSIEGNKFSLENSAYSFVKSKTYDIYYYKINGDYAAALNNLKKCPQLGVLFHEVSSNKYVISNITIDTAGSNISDLVNVYNINLSCTNSKKILCYYGAEENNTQSDKIASSYEILASSNAVGLYKMINTTSSVTYDKNYIQIKDFVCNAGYWCPSTSYFVLNTNNSTSSPASHKVTIVDNNYEVKPLKLTHSYAIPGNLYFMKVSLYDAEKNSGKSGNPEKNNNSGNNSGQSGTENPQYQGTEAFVKDCDKNPNSDKCKNALSNPNETKKVFSFCDEKGVLQALKIVSIVITIAKILVPILLIIFGSIDYGKAALSDKQDDLEKVTQELIKKLIIGLVVFLIPTAVNSLITFSQNSKDKSDAEGEFKKCALCFAGDKQCNSYIESASK